MVDAGFDDLKYAKQFRKMKIYQNQSEVMRKRILRKKKQYHDRYVAVQQSQVVVTEVEQKLLLEEQDDDEEGDDDDDDEEENEEKSNDEASMFGGMMERMQSLWGGGLPAPDEQAQAQQQEEIPLLLPKRTRRLQRKLLKHQRLLEKAQEILDSTTEQLGWLQQEYDALEPIIATEDYDRTMLIVKQVLRDVCPELALHIQQCHKRVIDQYQTLDSKTDLTKPHEWYYRARLDRRKIIFHGV